jgi:outer membrane protein assembly factor BamA
MRETILTSRISKVFVCLATSISLAIFAVGASGQGNSANNDSESGWSKNSQQRESRLQVAVREPYQVRHIYISGNNQIRDREFRKRLVRGFTEGDIFEREGMVKSIKRLSKFNAIDPIAIDDVDVRLDEKERYIDFTINVVERRKTK